jgi:hypothetical protein
LSPGRLGRPKLSVGCVVQEMLPNFIRRWPGRMQLDPAVRATATSTIVGPPVTFAGISLSDQEGRLTALTASGAMAHL